MMGTLPPRVLAVIGAAAMVLVANLVWVVAQLGVGTFEEGYELVAVFDRVGQGLDEFSDVRIRGVRVGSVDRLDFDPSGRAIVTMRMNPGVEVPLSSTAAVEPLSVFGPKFIRLVPGVGEAVGPFLAAGEEIVQTYAPQELGDILVQASAVLDAIDPEEAFTILRTVTETLEGQGPRIGRTLDDTLTLLALLDDGSATAEQLLTDLALLADTFEDRGDTIVQLGREASAVLPDYTDRAEDIGRLLEDASDVSHRLAGLLDRHADELGDLTVELDRVSGFLLGQRQELPVFLDALTEFFAGLGGVTSLEEPDGTQAGAVDFAGVQATCELLLGFGCPESAP